MVFRGFPGNKQKKKNKTQKPIAAIKERAEILGGGAAKRGAYLKAHERPGEKEQTSGWLGGAAFLKSQEPKKPAFDLSKIRA